MALDDDDKQALAEIARGFRKRTLKTVRLASRMGLKALRKQLRPDGSMEPPNETEAAQAAEVLVRNLDGLKGVLMKFGQMASYLDTTLPPSVRAALEKLQAASQPLAFEAIEPTLVEAFGVGPDEAFDQFERKPFAAASIGQVHRAELNGQAVAVKVQYPGIEKAMASDIKTLRGFARLGTLFSAMDGKVLIAELEERVLQECDYLAEARSQNLFKELLADDPRVDVPTVITDRTRPQVLTTAFVDGRSFQAFRDSASQCERDEAGQLIFETAFGSIFRHCVFNADPHPGNYLFPDDGRVVFLDFGCIRHFSAPFIELWKRLARAIVDDDRATFRRLYAELGFVPKPKRFDWDYQWSVVRYIYEPFTASRPFTYTAEYVQRSYDLMIWRNPNRMRTGMTAEWLFLNRLQWGLNSVLALLEATGPWPDLWRAFIESPTRPVVDSKEARKPPGG